jgi:ADP-heptose:LPS heptosyltransferase
MSTESAQQVPWGVVPYTRGNVLDIGGALVEVFGHFTAIDTAEAVSQVPDSTCDAVFSAYPVARIPDVHAAVADWWRCIKDDGHLVLLMPTGSGAETSAALRALFDAVRDVTTGWDIVERSDILVFRKRPPGDGARTHSWLTKRLKKTALVVRFGGFGDMLQAANILPELKRRGYHVTVMTTPKGQSILAHDPGVDAWIIQDDGQVPNSALGDYWECISARYTLAVNLNESVEGTLLTVPGRTNHLWPDNVRRAKLNDNYLEFTAALAGLPYTSESRFYPTDDERQAAQDRLGPAGCFNVVWALAGSSCHKFYPGLDVVIARILLGIPDCRIFLVGDEACKILEVGWEVEPRVVCLSGQIDIRDTLALAQGADCIIGCETGVLNAVAFETNGKVVLLSHSSVENLTKHWINTHSIVPANTPCYPCHRLHYDWKYCHQDAETGAAICQRDIHPDDVFDAVVAIFDAREAAA